MVNWCREYRARSGTVIPTIWSATLSVAELASAALTVMTVTAVPRSPAEDVANIAMRTGSLLASLRGFVQFN